MVATLKPPYYLYRGEGPQAAPCSYDELSSPGEYNQQFLAAMSTIQYAAWGSPVVLPDGNANEPGLSWAKDRKDGLLWLSSHVQGYVINSALITEWEASGFFIKPGADTASRLWIDGNSATDDSYLNFSYAEGSTIAWKFRRDGSTQDLLLYPSESGAIVHFYQTSKNIGFGDTEALFWDNANARLGIGTTSPLTPLHVGNGTVGDNGTTYILVSQNINDAGGNSGVNYHTFADTSVVTRTGTVAGACSFDAQISINGTASYGDYTCFEARPTYNTSGTMDSIEGFWWSPTVNSGSGTVTSMFGFKINNDYIGTGTVTNHYGFYCEALTKATNNWAIYANGATKSFFGGSVGMGTTTPRRPLDVLSTGAQIRVTYADNSVYGELRCDNSGNFIFAGTADNVYYATTGGTSYARFYRPSSDGHLQLFDRNAATGLLFGAVLDNPTLSFYESGSFKADIETFSGAMYVFTRTAADIILSPNVTEAVRIKSGGSVGIGTNSPDRRLEVLDTAGPQVRGTYTDSAVYWEIESTSAGVMSFITSGAGGYVFNEAQGDFDFRIEGDSISHLFFTDATATTENIAMFAAAAPNWQSMDRGIFIGDTSTAPTGNPASGGFLYSEGGALKWRGSGGTVTTIGPS